MFDMSKTCGTILNTSLHCLRDLGHSLISICLFDMACLSPGPVSQSCWDVSSVEPVISWLVLIIAMRLGVPAVTAMQRFCFIVLCDLVPERRSSAYWSGAVLQQVFNTRMCCNVSHWGPPWGGGQCSIDPWKQCIDLPKSLKENTSAPWKYLSFAPKTLKINSASSQIPKNISQFSIKCIFLSIWLNSHT